MTAIEYVGVDLSVIILSLGMTAVAIGLAEEHARSEREREHVTRRFRSYVDPALVKYVIEHPESERIGSEVRELTVVFTDLEGFTTISEKLREGVVELVNEYLRVMTPLIRNHNGYREKFLGDGMKFFYGAPERNPDHAIHAVSTVLKMDETMRELNRELAAKKRHLLQGFPRLNMRAGVSTGVMVVGDAGTEEASDYTVLGDTVNLGARLETANKAMGTRILLSERTVELIPPELFLVRPIARLRVVGRVQPVMTYEPLAFTKEATPAQVRCAELTRAMVDRFLQGDFAGCGAAVRVLEEAMGPSKLTELYRAWSAKYLAAPPGASFTGEIVLAEK
jgi:adenylate cyclase